ncbi:hypothetical protein Vretifemale_11650 [Volvox reticuliferus]|uniref:Uncharacterized protein n=1 Tax=Volvox reticuliferus TaxID=1737510 RepID=A0A8J4CMA7_9CHLO|nr:hypothetical protein Vretifemale_11650 [Volvox reticuliferus]
MMTDIVISRSLAKKMKAVAGDLPGKMKCNALVARATAVRHGFLGHGLMHGSSDHRSHQNPEAERNTHSSSQLQRPQLQPFSADSATYNCGLSVLSIRLRLCSSSNNSNKHINTNSINNRRRHNNWRHSRPPRRVQVIRSRICARDSYLRAARM